MTIEGSIGGLYKKYSEDVFNIEITQGKFAYQEY
jgi:hypothetical protein